MRSTVRRTVRPAFAVCLVVSIFGPLTALLRSQSIVSGTAVTVSADATDNVGVVGVQFYVDGTPLGAEDRAAPYTIAWDTTSWPDGSHSLTARARDAAGNQALSPAVPVIIDNGGSAGDTTPPNNVAVTSPAAGSTVSGTRTIAATAADNVGVASVQFRIGGVTIGSDANAPYLLSWDTRTRQDGPAAITVIAADAAGNQTTSPPLNVVVNNGGPGDTAAPYSVAVVSPAPGATVSGILPIAAAASDDVGVALVTFLVNGIPVGADEGAPYTVNWNSTVFADGSAAITVVAEDAAGNQAASPPVSVTVSNSAPPPPPPPPDESAPSVGMTGPANGATVSGSVIVTANAADDVGVAGVQFLLDGQPLGAEDTAAPYQFAWDTTGAIDGTHALSARARDAAGNQTTSAARVVTVDNPPAPGSDPDPGPGSSALDEGVVRLAIRAAAEGFLSIEARTDAGDRMALYIDGQLTSETTGRTMAYDWQIRSLLGSHEVRVVTKQGEDLVATASLFHSVSAADLPVVRFEVVEVPFIGATLIRARANNIAGASGRELYVDGELVLTQNGGDLEHAWAPESGRAYDLLFVVYDATGVGASISVVHVP